jgi:hypothetical protein
LQTDKKFYFALQSFQKENIFAPHSENFLVNLPLKTVTLVTIIQNHALQKEKGNQIFEKTEV